MNKSDLVDAVASSADVTKASAGRAVDAVLDSIGDALGKGDTVSLVGFGTFQLDIELLEKEETHKQVLQCILQHQKFQALKLVKD